MCFNSKILSLNKTYIVAVSGGPDSLFSLDNLRQSRYKIIVAHVNYHKRVESDREEILVKNYCQNYSLSCEVYSVQSSEYNLVSNFQALARKIRYNFFQILARKYQTKYIIIAHHFDDCLETYLLQKQRRSLVDYWGISPKTKYQKYWVLRPFLSFTKSQIIHYLNQKKISYSTDSTNQLPICQRNIIRQKLNSLGLTEKNNLAQEIKAKNQQLKKTKSLVKKEKKRLIKQNNVLELNLQPQLAPEIYLRLIYEWVNSITNGLLQQSKKRRLNEIYKQLFESPKKKAVVNLGSKWQIIKSDGQASLKIIKN
ncbi:MAG: tRNA lysidine(34) synthetase TilS [Candidatus Moeniiplasma glomeromycotorum]|nr:tRNA lysidine(34) synthetase TilS [Candidatus Moeniiplasma glomeromycotorum]MCE8167303.1 tRNA lysidine(34) synthetase TilS [Candidatus Moeniiplasma glomeromycotorum]MCE8168684.1 tRNA lysidine(34) synthetase TilS [Candidatus Moeniiplasma glomeromycotorum]